MKQLISNALQRIQPLIKAAARRRTLVCTLLTAVCVLCAGRLVADSPDDSNTQRNESADQPERSLDDQLLEGLEHGLLEDVDGLPGSDATTPADTGADTDSGLDAELIDQLLEGEDLGAGEDGDPLTRIGLRMQVAQRRIQARKTAAVTQRLQQQAIDELAAIIEKVRKSQCGGGECNSDNPSGSDRSGQPSSSNSQSRTPAKSAGPVRSTERVDASESAEAKVERRRALVKQVWGHLPERIRQKMPNTSDEEFLPKYAEIIEEYFERLSEEGRPGL